MENIQNKWNKTLELLKPEITEVSYETWFTPLVPKKLDENEKILYLECAEPFAYDILMKRYIPLIEGSVKMVFKQPYTIELVLKEDVKIKAPVKKVVEEENFGEEFADEFYFNPRYNFENFVVGKTNEHAHAVGLAVAEAPAKLYNPLFIYGASGLGKTHLMHAIGHYILKNNKAKKVLYVSSEMFTNEMITAIKDKNKIRDFKNKYRSVDVLLIDDIQFIEGKEATQEEFFHTFNTLYDSNKQIVISSDRPPSKLINLDDRLRSRFSWNIVVDIQTPDYETRVAILMKKAEFEGIDITDDVLSVIYLIAEKIKYNVRELEGAFTRIISFSKLLNRPITPNFVRETLKDIVSASDMNVTVESIKRYVCKYFNISLKDIESSKKTKNLAFPRQIAMYLSREMTEDSLPKIGASFGGRDHTTVLHAHNKIKKEMLKDSDINNTVNELIRAINEN